MIPYKSYDGKEAVMTCAEVHSAGRTHSHVEYALGLPLHSQSPGLRNIRALYMRMSDHNLAALLEMGPATVESIRNENDLHRPPAHHWLPWELDAVRVLSPTLASLKTGRSYSACVGKRREQLGYAVKWWTATDEAYLLANRSYGPTRLGKLMGRTPGAVRAKLKKLTA